jgi:phosphate transport system substrate-binding protein
MIDGNQERRRRAGLFRGIAAIAIAIALLASGCDRAKETEGPADLTPAGARTPDGQPLVRVQGGTTWDEILRPHLAEIERQSGVRVDLVGNGSWRGLWNLAEGRADVAVLAGDLQGLITRVNGMKPGAVKAEALRSIELAPIEVIFVVHPSNPVKELEVAELAGILTGKIVAWSEVGGEALPIHVVLPSKAEGTRVEARKQLLGDADFSYGAREMQSTAQVPIVVGREPEAIGCISDAHAHEGLTVLKIKGGAPIKLPMLLVTAGEPSPEAKRVLDAIVAHYKKP